MNEQILRIFLVLSTHLSWGHFEGVGIQSKCVQLRQRRKRLIVSFLYHISLHAHSPLRVLELISKNTLMGLSIFLKLIAMLEKRQKTVWFFFFSAVIVIWYFCMKFEGLL